MSAIDNSSVTFEEPTPEYIQAFDEYLKAALPVKHICDELGYKLVVVFRGLPGSGKSSICKAISEQVNATKCSADDFFFDDDGNYCYDGSKIVRMLCHCHLNL